MTTLRLDPERVSDGCLLVPTFILMMFFIRLIFSVVSHGFFIIRLRQIQNITDRESRQSLWHFPNKIASFWGVNSKRMIRQIGQHIWSTLRSQMLSGCYSAWPNQSISLVHIRWEYWTCRADLWSQVLEDLLRVWNSEFSLYHWSITNGWVGWGDTTKTRTGGRDSHHPINLHIRSARGTNGNSSL